MTDIKANIIPTMRYRDVAAAVEWLCRAFGFEKHLVVDGENGGIVHAQLTYENGMIMLGPVERESEFSQYMKQPDEIGGAQTQSPYIIVSDPDAHYAKAKAEDAAILIEIKDEDYGGRVYACRDPEGHIWNFGSYNPWTAKS